MRFILGLVFLFLSVTVQARDMLIGDSHAGGLKPYLKMEVRYRNGTTASYWLKQKPVYGLNRLYILTGTNEQFGGVSPRVWISQVNGICGRWRPNSCIVVTPPPNRKRNWSAYWNVINRPRVSWVSFGLGRDGVHYSPSAYRAVARKM